MQHELTRDEWRRIGVRTLTAACVGLAAALGKGLGQLAADALRSVLMPEPPDEDDPVEDDPEEGED